MVGELNCLSCYRSSAIVGPSSGQSLGQWEGVLRCGQLVLPGTARCRQVDLRSRAAPVRCLQESPAQRWPHISLADRRELRVISSDAASSFKSRFCIFILSRLFLIDPFWRVWRGPGWELASQSCFCRGSLTQASAKAI